MPRRRDPATLRATHTRACSKTLTFYNVLRNVRKLVVVQLGPSDRVTSDNEVAESDGATSDAPRVVDTTFLANNALFRSHSSSHFDDRADRRQQLMQAVACALQSAAADGQSGVDGKPQICVEQFDSADFEAASEAAHLTLYQFDKKAGKCNLL